MTTDASRQPAPYAVLTEADEAPVSVPRERRPYHTRARTESIKRLSKRELARDAMRFPPVDPADYPRPRTRGDCLTADEKIDRAHTEGRTPERSERVDGCNAQRPCPWVSCTHHLALDVNERTGSIKRNFPDLEVGEMTETCSLDIADRGGITLEEVGEITNLTRERIRQLELTGLRKLRAAGERELRGFASVDVPVEALTRKKRRVPPPMDADPDSDD